MPARVRSERGAVAVEFMLVIGAMILTFLVLLQYAVRAHAEHIASAAATQGLAAAAAYDGTAGAGRTSAQDYLNNLGPGLTNATVTVHRTATTATVTITGDALTLIPFGTSHIHVEVHGPVEHFVQATP